MDKLTSTPVSAGIVAAAVVVVTVVYFTTASKADGDTKKRLKLPLIGDLHSSPIDKPLLNWDAWAKENGPLPTPKLKGIIPMVIINTLEGVTELFSRRSQWYSNRPPSVSMEMITNAEPGASKFTLMHDYDDHLKLHHRLLSPSLGSVAEPQYQPLMERDLTQLLHDLSDLVAKSGDVVKTTAIFPFLERAQASIVLSIHYGMRIANTDEPIMEEIIHTQQQVTHLAANPALPDMIPLLRYLPSALSPWKQWADKLYAQQLELYMRLYNHGKTAPGWNATKQALLVADKVAGPNSVPAVDLAFTLATSIQGGMEALPRQILWLLVAGIAFPGWWKKAQAVLDEVVGRDRLPSFSDRSKLAFIEGVTHELLRWRPLAPGSVPRRADKADEWNGVKIVKGAVLMANAWAIGRDQAVFDPAFGDLQDFIPERWLAADASGKESKLRTDLPLPVFGQGRRMCLGKRVAVDGTFMQATRLLWAFDIEPVGSVDPWAMDVAGFMIIPAEFQFKLKPRGPWVREVVAREWQAYEAEMAEAG